MKLERGSWSSSRKPRRAHRTSSRWHRLGKKCYVRGKAGGREGKFKEHLEDTEVGEGDEEPRAITIFYFFFSFLAKSKITSLRWLCMKLGRVSLLSGCMGNWDVSGNHLSVFTHWIRINEKHGLVWHEGASSSHLGSSQRCLWAEDSHKHRCPCPQLGVHLWWNTAGSLGLCWTEFSRSKRNTGASPACLIPACPQHQRVLQEDEEPTAGHLKSL